MPVPTMTHAPAPAADALPVHVASLVEKWLAQQPSYYVGRHRGAPAPEDADEAGTGDGQTVGN
jgi:hypothetical protein